MALLTKAFDAQVEECVHVSVYVPPLVWNGKKYKLTDDSGAVMGRMPPIDWLIPDGEGGHITARFYPLEMRWEVIEGAGDG